MANSSVVQGGDILDSVTTSVRQLRDVNASRGSQLVTVGTTCGGVWLSLLSGFGALADIARTYHSARDYNLHGWGKSLPALKECVPIAGMSPYVPQVSHIACCQTAERHWSFPRWGMR